MSAEWSLLPSDLVRLILQELTKIQDNISFCAVCKPWFNIGQDEKLQRMKNVTHNRPPLLLTQSMFSTNLKESFSLYDVEDAKTYVCHQKVSIPAMPTSFGWFGTSAHFLLNPFSGNIIQLPEIPIDKFGSFTQVILSDDPSLNPNNYSVCGIVNNTFCILRPGDKGWTAFNVLNFDGIAHALFDRGQLYMINLNDSLIKINLDYKYLDTPIVECLIQGHVQHPLSVSQTLAISVDRELLCIKRFEFTGKKEKHYTKKFKVFKLVITKDGQYYWIRKESLGKQTLFVGNYYSISVPSGDHLCPNCIYYAYDGDGGDVGLFFLRDQSRDLFYSFEEQGQVFSKWISPTLQ